MDKGLPERLEPSKVLPPWTQEADGEGGTARWHQEAGEGHAVWSDSPSVKAQTPQLCSKSPRRR